MRMLDDAELLGELAQAYLRIVLGYRFTEGANFFIVVNQFVRVDFQYKAGTQRRAVTQHSRESGQKVRMR